MGVLSVLLVLAVIPLLGLMLAVLVNPHTHFFRRLFGKNARRSKAFSVFLPAAFISLVTGGLLSPPGEPKITDVSLSQQREVISETYTVTGKVRGDVGTVQLNGEALEIKNSAFSKQVTLKPGDNAFKLTGTTGEGREFANDSYTVYFDYEGSLYAAAQAADKAEAEALQKKLDTVPRYEVVRKQNMADGFSAIVYMDGQPEDYLVSNVVKDLKQKHASTKAVSALVFQKSAKPQVEKILESTDVSAVAPLVRANYEKRPDSEQLFLFPTGLSGSKLALEI